MRPQVLPRHVAIIMDGNGRWAERRGHARFFGHVRGAAKIRGVVEEAVRSGVEALTLFAFSTENWKRPESEREVLWALLERYLRREVPRLDEQNIRLRVIGERHRLPASAARAIEQAERALSGNTGMVLNLALSYGSRAEIVEAARGFARLCAAGKARPEDLNEEVFGGLMQTAALGRVSDVDLVIRTSGEQRISNFLLWQSAYAELVFWPKPWPEFSERDFKEILEGFSRRERRFGGLSIEEGVE
jgi:undecaprenyl diphosphate synthase